jgi:hypothetical protein
MGQDQDHQGPDPEPIPWGPGRRPRSSSLTSSDSDPDPGSHLQSYAQVSSSFKGGTTVNAIVSVRDPTQSNNPLATHAITVGLDSYSDVTVAHRKLVYNVRAISERLSTGGGPTSIRKKALLTSWMAPILFAPSPL